MRDFNNGQRTTILDGVPGIRTYEDLTGERNYNRLTGWPASRESYEWLMRGIVTDGGTSPRLAMPELFEPGSSVNQAAFAVGPGYHQADDGNPNGNTLCLFTDQKGLVLGLPAADAPPCLIATRDGQYVGILAGKQQFAYPAVFDAINLVAKIGYGPADLLIHIGPGATAHPLDDRKMHEIIAEFAPAAKRFTQPDELANREDGRVNAFDLSEYVRQLWVYCGVPEENISYDRRDTRTTEGLPSKVRDLGDGPNTPLTTGGVTLANSGAPWRSGIMAIVKI